MGLLPSADFRKLLHSELKTLLDENPLATSNEAYLQNYLEFRFLNMAIEPRYLLRMGINYHGAKVQQIQLDAKGVLVGWNPTGDALKTGKKAKLLLAGYTILDREAAEPMMSDSKFGGGPFPKGKYLRIEYKVRGWLGKTKNLDGKQQEKDFDLLKNDKADLLVLCLSETAHQKWRGHGPKHQVSRRSSLDRLKQVLMPLEDIASDHIATKDITFEGQQWRVTSQMAIGAKTSAMPGAMHTITLVSLR